MSIRFDVRYCAGVQRCGVLEVNRYLMASFSAEHRRCEELSRRRQSPSLTATVAEDVDNDHSSKTCNVPPIDAAFDEEIDQLLAQCGPDVYWRQKRDEEERAKLAAKVS